MTHPTTIAELRKANYHVLSVKDELRNNLIAKLKNKEQLFPGIIGYEETVIPQLVNALLAKHDIILLGLRGQAKSRLLRELPSLLDEFIPVIKDCEINDNPFKPVCNSCVEKIREHNDNVEIDWIHRDERFNEKLATPDVTISDLIGDIDPIKAATKKLHFAHEGAIHYGIIPRTNRGIFAINELPDLQPRIQVGLFNIMEEKFVQIRGFSIRIPLDVMMVFTANPEDYTNRGNIITPLKDRIDSQIITHYPLSLEDGIAITEQESWTNRNGKEIVVPFFFKEIIESIAFEARKSEYVDQKSGVSARLTISAMENLISNAERRAIMNDEEKIVPRICDMQRVLPSMTGKVELVFEGEQEGSAKVSKALIGKAVREVFKFYFPDPTLRKTERGNEQRSESRTASRKTEFDIIVHWFESGNQLQLSDEINADEYFDSLNNVPTLCDVAKKFMRVNERDREVLAATMEFVLDGLHQFSKIARDEMDNKISYKDMVSSIFVPGNVED
ncbi:MAG: magnesium chelatase [Ignavibacteriales bacterium]|nr:magnesium chelatase [Ignavibacteriales bacterium]